MLVTLYISDINVFITLIKRYGVEDYGLQKLNYIFWHRHMYNTRETTSVLKNIQISPTWAPEVEKEWMVHTIVSMG